MIFVECNPDKNLVGSLVKNEKIRHKGGKGPVCHKLSKETRTKGLVDEDPWAKPPSYFETLTFVEERHSVKKFVDKKRGNSLIVLVPELEPWIFKAVEEARSTMSAFRLPGDLRRFRDAISARPERIEEIVKEIFPQSERLKTLKQFLEED